MDDKTAKLIADKLEMMDVANGEHDAKLALAIVADNAAAAWEVLALVRSSNAPAAYVRAYVRVIRRAGSPSGAALLKALTEE